MTRAPAIRARCKECAGNAAEVKRCQFPDCSLYRWRGWVEDKAAPGVRLTRRPAIRAYCRWCTKDQTVEIRLCPAIDCALYPYRGSGSPGPDSVRAASPRRVEPNRGFVFGGA